MECWSVGIEASSDIGRKVKRANSTNQEQSQTNSINQPKTANSDISRQVNSKKEKKGIANSIKEDPPCPWDKDEICIAVAEHGQLEVMKWLRREDVLKWVRSNEHLRI
jgi:hypothetical protein